MDMDKKDKEPKGGAATGSKMAAAAKRQVGGESPSPGQGATSSQNQGGSQNMGATGTENKSASITPQQQHGAVGSQPDQGATGSQQNQGAGGGQNLMQQAKQTTSEVVNQVQEQASSQINRQKDTAASELSTVVNAVRRFGETLNNEGQGPIARFAAQYGDKAADSLDKFANYLREQDPKRLLNDVQNFGRRQPALLIGGAFLLGLAGARLIKSTMDAASSDSGSINMGTQRSMNMGTQASTGVGGHGSRDMGTRGSMGTGGQSLNTNVSGARPLTPPNTI